MAAFMVANPIACVAASLATNVAAGIGAYALLRDRPTAPEPVSYMQTLLNAATPRVRYAVLGALLFGGAVVGARKLRSGPRILAKPNVQESRVEGSVESPQMLPSCQVYLGYQSKCGAIELIGSGMRIEAAGRDWLLTAAHNLAFEDDLYIIRGANFMKVGRTSSAIQIGTDAAILEVPTGTWTRLGIQRAKFSPMPMKGKVYVNIVGLQGKGTTGALVAEPELLGVVTYDATTAGGYSGAPYVSGSNVYGMHTMGGRRNGGYSALYIYNLVNIAINNKPEAYDRAFFNKLFRQKRSAATRGYSDYLVQYVGDYAIVQNDDGFIYRCPREDYLRYMEEVEEQDFGDVEVYSDDGDIVYENALNSQRPGPSRAGHSSASAAQLRQVGESLTKMIELQQQSLQQQGQLLTQSGRRSGRQNSTARQRSRQQRQSARSASTPASAPSGSGTTA